MSRKKEKSPAFQVYPKDALSDEVYQLMNNRQKGIYWDFLMRTWVEGSIPSDIPELALLAKEDVRDFESLWPLISRKFQKRGNRLINSRLLKEKKKQKQYSKRMQENAKKLWVKKSLSVPDRESNKSVSDSLPSKPSHSIGNALQFASSFSALAPSVGSQGEPQTGVKPPLNGKQQTTAGRVRSKCHPLTYADPDDRGVLMCNSCNAVHNP